MEHKNYNAIHKSVRKKDSMQLLLGKPVYTDDITGPAPVSYTHLTLPTTILV